ncbi:hypothetical protein CJ030_MR1G027737 [Morella rubra]|uniref:Uncharacterized protein n=1 Tax=Morella rubra TaxID=262757 RepID=A0A6A1WPR7_9ROSI|nr:hypothetical protein CJ030_MR1G027737 [Morella rubra]
MAWYHFYKAPASQAGSSGVGASARTPDEDPPHLHDHYSPNDEDKTNEDPPRSTQHYIPPLLAECWDYAAPAWGRSSPPNAPTATPTQPRDNAIRAQVLGGGVASRTRSSDRLWGLAQGSGTPRKLFIDLIEPAVDTQTTRVIGQ